MSTVGQVERKTQRRVVKLFRDTLGYDYLGGWTDRAGNCNVEEHLLRKFLREQQGYDEALVTRALHLLDKAAGDTSKSLYDRNRDVYGLLRYAVNLALGRTPLMSGSSIGSIPRRITSPSPRKSPLRLPTTRPTRNARMSCSTSTASRSASWS